MNAVNTVEKPVEVAGEVAEEVSLKWGIFPKGAPLFFALVLGTIGSVYFLPDIFATAWQFGLLVAYYRSDDEPLWMAVFYVISDGFMGFLGLYDASLQLLPGLPAIQVGQLYIILSIVKASQAGKSYPLFYKRILQALGIYMVFLILMGFFLGLSGGINVYFRIFKYSVPMLLFFSVPRLLTNEKDYIRLFAFIFPVAVLALPTQLTDIVAGTQLTALLGASEGYSVEVSEDYVYRGFYNGGIITIAYFAALYFLALRKPFNLTYLALIVISIYAMVFLSATRGWIIGFGSAIILYFIAVLKVSPTVMFRVGVLVGGLLLIGLTQSAVSTQIQGSINRLLTLEDLAEGDLSAGGTLKRIDERSPRVVNKWKESPILGWGFSDEYYNHHDIHVGNQNILLHSGIVGGFLALLFFGIFSLGLISLSLASGESSLLTFPIFLLGWFFIHSSSGQQFAFYGSPTGLFTQSIFFSFGALVYYRTLITKK